MAHLTYQGRLEGHKGWITSMSTTVANPKLLLSSSRDKSLITWDLERTAETVGSAVRRFTGHGQAVSDCALANNGQFAVSSSWDGTLRLWDVASGKKHRVFKGHNKDVLSVAFSVDNRTIASAGRDGTVKLWNALGECKHTFKNHSDWATKVRFAPTNKESILVSTSWDRSAKVFSANDTTEKFHLAKHEGQVNACDIAVDGTLCVTGGKDCKALLWDISKGEETFCLETGAPIVAVAFCPSDYLLVVSTEATVKIFNLEGRAVVQEIGAPETLTQKVGQAWCTAVKFSADGRTLFLGAIDGNIYVYGM